MDITEQDEIEMGFCSECRKYKPACTCPKPNTETPGHIAAGIICENLSEFIAGFNGEEWPTIRLAPGYSRAETQAYWYGHYAREGTK